MEMLECKLYNSVNQSTKLNQYIFCCLTNAQCSLPSLYVEAIRRANDFETSHGTAEGIKRPPRDKKLMKFSSLHFPVSLSSQQASVSGFIFLVTYPPKRFDTSRVCSLKTRASVSVTDI